MEEGFWRIYVWGVESPAARNKRPGRCRGGGALAGVTHTGSNASDGDHQRLFNARVRLFACFFRQAGAVQQLGLENV